MARIIDGKRIAKEIRQELQEEVAMLKERHPGFMPGLAIVQIGDRCDSNRYIKFQLAAAAEIGIVAVHYKLPSSSSLAEVVHKINDLNEDPRIHGILVQMPTESDEPMDQDALLNAVSPEKDVDGLTDHNAGKLARGELGQCFLPCTPRGCMELLKRSGVDVEGKRVAVLGRSKIVGAPMSDLLRAHNATVTMCHSRTKNIDEIIRESDVIVAGIQQPCFVQKEWIKPGAVVIDCGINFVDDATTGSELEEDDPFSKTGRKMVGDVDYNGVREVAGAITPVPGGVGPMTVAMLMGNTVESAKRTVEGTLGDQWKMRYLPLRPKDPVPSDIEVSGAQKPKEVSELAQELQLLPSEIDSYGKTKAKISLTVLDPLKDSAPGKYIVVGGKNVFACVHQPSQGPTFGIKGGAAGGGCAQVIPMEEAQPRRVCRRNKRHANFQRALALVTQGLSLRRAALKCDIPESTLRDRYHGRTKSSMVPGRGTMLTPDDERALVEHLEKLASYGYGLTKTQVLHLATDMADELGRRSAKVKGRLFTKTWFRLFLKRWPKLHIKSPSKLEMNRAKGTTKEALSSYFQELERTMEEYNLKDKPDWIYNVDETNLNAEHKPPKVTTGADIRIKSITSHRIGTTSLLACGNAAGRSLPPYYVFKGKQRIPELLSGALPGSKMFMTSSGWSNSTVFRDYLENHFIPALPPRAENEFVMLMYDGHTSHICKPVIEFAHEHKIVLFVLPAHTSHVTQSADVSCFSSLKVSYLAECARYMQENPGEVITRYDIARLSSTAYLRALREKNLKSAFRKAGIFPLDPGAAY